MLFVTVFNFCMKKYILKYDNNKGIHNVIVISNILYIGLYERVSNRHFTRCIIY